MLKLLLSVLVFMAGSVSCVQSENSNSQDADTYSNIGGHPGFAAVRAILRTNCSNCHIYHTLSEEQLVTAGVLKLGDAANSAIYFRLSGSTQGGGPKSMPTGGSLGITEIQQIEKWIDDAQ